VAAAVAVTSTALHKMVELMDGTFTSFQEKEYSAEFAIPLVERTVLHRGLFILF
jgi:hypothetical protein